MNIPKNMDNDESKLVAEIVALEREYSIVAGKLYGARNRYEMFKFSRDFAKKRDGI